MGGAVFKKLQNVILHPSRTREQFSMAKQAINAVCALVAEHPDAFCDEAIKKLAARAFGSPRRELSSSEPRAPEAAQEGTQEEHAGDFTTGAM